MHRPLLALALTLLACTTQPAGARCEQDLDCNGAANERCRLETEPTTACDPRMSCICCPSDPAAAAQVPGCAVTRFTPDGGVADR